MESRQSARVFRFMKKTAGFLFFMVLLGAVQVRAEEAKYVGANWSDRYHYPNCKIAQKIRVDELVTFASPEEADAAGYVPCKKCNPPAPKTKKTDKANFSFGSKKEDPS
jgi:predicted nucleic acid binding AN1-type Zn finger protein